MANPGTITAALRDSAGNNLKRLLQKIGVFVQGNQVWPHKHYFGL